jgi:hypothetical protein
MVMLFFFSKNQAYIAIAREGTQKYFSFFLQNFKILILISLAKIVRAGGSNEDMCT